MPTGSNAYKGLAVPLYGEFEQVGQTTANDQVTWTQKGGATGDMMVWRSSAGTEYSLIDASGSLILKDNIGLEFGSLSAAAGDITMNFDGTSLVIASTTGGTRIDFGSSTVAATPDVRFAGGQSGTGAGAEINWDSSSARFGLRASTASNRALLNMTGARTVPSTQGTTGFAQGDMFLVDALGVTTLRLGVCHSGSTARYSSQFSQAITGTT